MIVMSVLAGKEWRCSYREQACGHIGEGDSGTNIGSVIGIYTPPRVKQTASGKVWDSPGSSARGSVMT